MTRDDPFIYQQNRVSDWNNNFAWGRYNLRSHCESLARECRPEPPWGFILELP